MFRAGLVLCAAVLCLEASAETAAPGKDSPAAVPAAQLNRYSYACRALTEPGSRSLQVGEDHTVQFADGKVGIFPNVRGALMILDPAKETLTPQEPHGTIYARHAVPLPNDRVLLLSDQRASIYDYVTSTTTPAANTYPTRFASLAVPVELPNGNVVFCGGSTGDVFCTECVIFDSESRSFSLVGRLRVGRARHTATWLGDNKVLVAGGCPLYPELHSNDSLEIYDLTARASMLLDTPMSTGRMWHAAVRLPDGKVLLVGGIDQSKHPCMLRSAEVFDPRLGKTIQVSAMAVERSEPSAVLLPSGRVAIFGGLDDMRLTEIYCPEDQRFIFAEQLMLAPRRILASQPLLLKTGDVLLLGGRVNSSSECLDLVELFRETKLAAAAAATGAESTASVAALLAQLGDESFDRREAATLKLVELGSMVEPLIRRLLESDDPEVRNRAHSILAKVKAGQSKQVSWSVDIHAKNGGVERRSFTGRPPREELLALAAPAGVEYLEAHFSPGTTYEQQGRLFNAVGLSRVPRVLLGRPLQTGDSGK